MRSMHPTERSPAWDLSKDIGLHEDLHVYDVTLRDGAQTPSVDFSAADKRDIARRLDAMGVRYIEAGYPASLPSDREAIEVVTDAVSDATVTALAKADEAEIDAAVDTGVDSVSVFVAGSDTHLEQKWDLTPEQAVERAREGVAYAVDHGLEVRFAVVDATRTPLERLRRFAEAAEAGGATFLGLSDTLGLLTPRDSGALVERVSEWTDLDISVHDHDDLDLATANALAAAEAGAAQLHTTVTGIGANGGNTPLAPTATALRVRYDKEVVDLSTLSETAGLVADRSCVELPPHAAVIGENAFRYGSAPRVSGV
jgi:methanogen homocitrate synthase